MTTDHSKRQEYEALEGVLDVYGADRTRWPARVRLTFASLLTGDETAIRMLNEAAALDRVLALAPNVSSERRDALARRIEAAAGSVSQGAEIITLPLRAKRGFVSSGVQAAMVLAASLVLGVLAGASGTIAPALQDMAAVAGLDDQIDARFVGGADEQLSSIMGEDVI